MTIQYFGDEQPAAEPFDQTGAYAVVLNEAGELLLIEDRGRYYLPGGRLEEGESPEQALVREFGEECGRACVAGAALGSALQPIFGGRIRLLATYWRAEIGEKLHDRPEHPSHWRSLAEAAALLHREADREILARLAG